MRGEATLAAFDLVAVCLRTAAARIFLVFLLLCAPASFAQADPQNPPGWREVWAGADVGQNVWLVYSGATIAPYSDMFSDGLRLRAAVGYGAYSYTGERKALPQTFHARTAFSDALVGYLKRFGPLTAKAFVGVSAIDHDIHPWDPENSVQGFAFGPKGVVELWLNMGASAWSSMDLAWTSAHQTYSGRARSGYRVYPGLDLSLGVEARVDGNEQDRDTRGGLFIRHAWTGGEVSLAGGISGRFFDEADTTMAPYGTLTWLLQY